MLPENHNSEGRALLSFFTDVNATQLIDKPTRVTATSRTLIDIITVSNPGLMRRSDVQELTISDHYLVYASLDLKVPKQSKISITTRTFKNYVAEEFAEDISRVPWDSLELLNSIDEKVEAFNDLFMACLDKHAPLKSFKVKNKPKPFIANEIKQSIRNLLKKAKFLRTPEAWCAFKSYRHQVKLEIRSAEKRYYSEQIMENKNNSSSIWKTVRTALPRKVSREVLYSKDTATLAEEFNQFFVSTGAKAAQLLKSLPKRFVFIVIPQPVPDPMRYQKTTFFTSITLPLKTSPR